MAYTPVATYRLQISPSFTLQQTLHLIPYLQELGISTIYAAPIFCARPGSEHGYDVTAPYDVNPEVGTQQDLSLITNELRSRGMGWLQDIVPNHMAFHPDNVWLMDVLEKGPQSSFYTFFDIDFKHPDFAGQVMVPFLGDTLEKVIKEKQLTLDFSKDGLKLKYFDNAYPVSIASYQTILQEIVQDSGEPAISSAVAQLLKELHHFEKEETVNPAAWTNYKKKLFEHAVVKEAINNYIAQFNNSDKELKKLLAKQHFILCHWKDTEKQINYRRFFTVNDLICLCMERQDVFEQYHQFILQLCHNKQVQGLRIDHIDGLLDPSAYLNRLREAIGPDQYLIVEKILEGKEQLPEKWPIQGNSGYDFLAWVSNLYTSGSGRKKLTEIYHKLVPDAPHDYEQLVYNKKLFILENYMQGELENLLRILQERHLIPLDDTGIWRKALAVLLASFPVYCIYGNRLPLSEKEMVIVDEAFEEAYREAPNLKANLQHLHTLFTLTPEDTEDTRHHKLYFVMRSQQFTGPLAAKGVEDTTFYNYNRLISLNEVGNSPDIFHMPIHEFHDRMLDRQHNYPLTLNATATHDTKRGEGARIRLNVLSELPDEWEEHVKQWIELSRKYTSEPTANDLYFIFQTILGVLPPKGEPGTKLVKRLQQYLEKALREAKVNTDWAEPNEAYENEIKDLVKNLLLEDQEFIKSFMPFFKKVAHYGWQYALCQTLLKITCPGVPDIYQGTELWDLSLVDPDNRRPVDYRLRQHYLLRIRQQENQNSFELHRELLQHWENGQVKLYLMYKALNARNNFHQLFSQGNYVPLTITGKYSTHALAFARNYKEQWALVVVPLLLTKLVTEDNLPLGPKVWEDTAIVMPDNLPKSWRHVFGSETLQYKTILPLAEIFKTFPVAFLTALDTHDIT